jgi:hypothetical protein
LERGALDVVLVGADYLGERHGRKPVLLECARFAVSLIGEEDLE